MRWMLAALLASLAGPCLAACAQVAPARPAVATKPARPQVAAASLMWLVSDGPAIAAGLLPLEGAPEAPAAPADATALDTWAEPASAWMTEELHAVVADTTSPVRAARALMLLGVAMGDGVAVAGLARSAGADVSDDAVLAEAASRVIAYTHPTRGRAVAAAAEQAAWAGVWRGQATAAGVVNGRRIGAAVAERVVRWGAEDGSLDLNPSLPLPAPRPGVWQPTGPAFDRPELPEWGRVRTVAVGDPSRLRPPPPPAWDSAEMRASYEAFVAAQRGLGPEEKALATTWAAGLGTVTPPGLWVQIARDLIAAHRVPTPQAAHIYAALGVALHDSAVACWEAKYTYWLARPQQAMQATDPAWRPLIKTPPHPSYPSGHATFSGAASAVLAAHFPAEAPQLRAWAEEAARSRVLAGIHWPIDGAAGLAQGRAVAELVLRRAGE